MKILDKYLFKSVVKFSLATLFSLVLIFALFQFIEELTEVGEKEYTLRESIHYILFLFPSYFNSLTVISLMMGTVFSLGQLNSNRELQIFQTASISNKSLIVKTIKYPFLLSIILIVFFELIAPQSLILADQIKSKALGNYSSKFRPQNWLKQNNNFLFMSLDKNNNLAVKIFNINEENLLSYTSGEGAHVSEDILIMGKSKKIEFEKDENYIKPKESISQDNISLGINISEIESLSRNVKTMLFVELIKNISSSYINQNIKREFLIEIISRAIKPFTLIGMILLAIPYILNFQRNISISKRIFLSIVIGSITHLLTKILSVISLKFDSMTLVGPILPTIVLILVGVIILKIKLKVLN